MDRTIMALGISFVAIACGGSQMDTASERNSVLHDGKDQKVPLATYESTFNPSAYEEDIEAIKRALSTSPTTAAGEDEKDSVIVQEEMHQGFRIQIFATSSIDEANFLKAVAAPKVTEDSIYVVYDPPVYKVRIGDYSSRLFASQKLPSIISKGYADAWVVADRIIQRKYVKVNTPAAEKPKE